MNDGDKEKLEAQTLELAISQAAMGAVRGHATDPGFLDKVDAKVKEYRSKVKTDPELKAAILEDWRRFQAHTNGEEESHIYPAVAELEIRRREQEKTSFRDRFGFDPLDTNRGRN